MTKKTCITIGIAAGCAVAGCVSAWLIIHRRVIAATIKGDTLPEPPAWHKKHPCLKK